MYTPGDLLRIHGENDADWYAEILEAPEGDEIEICYLEPTRDQGGLIWRFSDDASLVHVESIREHVVVERPMTRKTVVNAWKALGFVVDIHNFAREEDFNAGRVLLNIEHMDEDSGDEKDEYDTTDGFVVDDDVANEPFTLADPSQLDAEAAAWVRETHEAINKYNTWHPTDRSGIGIKMFVDNLARRASNDANNRRWGKRMREVDFKVPPRG